jgi:hypothetical protein
LRSPGREFDEPGILKYGGYCTGGARMMRYRYHNETGGATVEVAENPASYPYAKHDFLGTFFHALQEQKNKEGQDAGEIVIPIDYVDWQTAKPRASHVICVLSISSNDAYHGIAGWYAESNGGVTTVMLRFGAPRGLPRAVIDEYLNKYPSSIRGTVPSLESWEADDIAKWTTLLQTRANEEVILNVGSLHLHRYDAGAFGLMEAWNKRSDSNALAEEIDKSIGRMKAWLAEREAKKRDGSGRKHDGE